MRSPIVELARFGRTDSVARAFRAALPTDAFNPSLRTIDGVTHVAVREPSPDGAIRSVVYRFDGSTCIDRRDLTDSARSAGIPIAADPKLTVIHGEPWITFNTGWDQGHNHLYLCHVDRLAEPLECVFDERNGVEKNWAFFTYEGQIGALYSLRPLRVLVGEVRDRVVRFTRVSGPPVGPPRRRTVVPTISIGSQPVVLGGKLRLIAHEKYTIGRSRLYVARAVEADVGASARVTIGRTRMIHQMSQLRARRPRRNPHLFGCTYVSGLDLDGQRAFISYGVNDRALGLAALDWESVR